ncbi:AAA family ATPase [Streptomyces erythrochromogenes]|uniref:AAA family ATPase n=1 Tax=Streptomyces erythrochromogenes TaxID=285574 RepID=UPI0004CCEC70|nr:AAA family ATPase [Streptomyces erythrochromogenes]
MSDDPSLEEAQLYGRLRAARRGLFVGREAEIGLFREALGGRPDDADTLAVLCLHGPGGIGKSTLLQRFEDEAAAAERPVVRVDLRRTTCWPVLWGVWADQVRMHERAVLLVDDADQCEAWEEEFPHRFLPLLPRGTLVVMTARRAPADQWVADPGWRRALRVVRLAELAADSAAELLHSEGVRPELHEKVLDFAGGHPLALRLAAASAAYGPTHPAMWHPSHDLVRRLRDHLVGDVPCPDHLRALQVCAHTRATTEDLLREVLPSTAPAPLFDWLRRQPYIDSGPSGLSPHDAVRAVLDADMRWRDPQGYADMHERVRTHVVSRALTAGGPFALPAAMALTHLHRPGGFMGRFVTWQEADSVHEDHYHSRDREALLGLTERAEGSQAAAAAGFWIARRPDAFRVLRRTDTGEPVAFTAWLELRKPDGPETSADPVLATVWEHCRETAPLRDGEHLAVARFLVPPDGRQEPSPITDMLLHRVLAQILHSQNLAWSYVALAGMQWWRPFFTYLDQHPLASAPGADDRVPILYAHDWRAMPLRQWLTAIGRLELDGTNPNAGRGTPGTGEPAALSRTEFEHALHDAFRNWHRPAALQANPLTRSALLAGYGEADLAARVRHGLMDAVDALRESPGTEPFHALLTTTFIDSARTRQSAALRLGLPFGTYRRHLAKALHQVSDHLWVRELCRRAHP